MGRSTNTAWLLALAVWLGTPASAAAQGATTASTSAPATQPADLFDFWLGDWNLRWINAEGAPGTGRNRVTKILDGSVIQEEFEALSDPTPPLLKGRSLSVMVGGVWRQSWVDNQGGYFNFTAQTDGDTRIFVTGPRPLKDGTTLLQRMVFHSITPRSLTWDWQASTDGGRTWLLQWRVLYSR